MLDIIMQVPPVDYFGPEGGRLAMAFAAGCVFAGGTLWTFIVGPLKKDRDDWRAECTRLSNEIRDIHRDAIAYLRNVIASQGSGGGPNA